MGNSSYFQFDDDNKTKYIYDLNHHKSEHPLISGMLPRRHILDSCQLYIHSTFSVMVNIDQMNLLNLGLMVSPPI